MREVAPQTERGMWRNGLGRGAAAANEVLGSKAGRGNIHPSLA